MCYYLLNFNETAIISRTCRNQIISVRITLQMASVLLTHRVNYIVIVSANSLSPVRRQTTV